MQLAYKKCGYPENSEHSLLKKKSVILNFKKRKKSDKFEGFIQQVKQGPYYICTICHRSLYQCRVKFFKHEKYQTLTPDLYHLVKSFDEKLNICETCQKHLYKSETPCQAVCNKMALDSIPDQLKDLKKIEKFQEHFV